MTTRTSFKTATLKAPKEKKPKARSKKVAIAKHGNGPKPPKVSSFSKGNTMADAQKKMGVSQNRRKRNKGRS